MPAIDHYTINSFMLDAKQLHAADGKLLIYVQKDEPNDPKRLKNWLPASEGFENNWHPSEIGLVD